MKLAARRRACASLSVVVIACSVSSCANASEHPTASSTEAGDIYAAALADATENGASPDQIAELDVAHAARVVRFEVAKRATQRAVECMLDSGLDAEYRERVSSGVLLPDFVVSVPQDAAEGTAETHVERCDTSESYWVNKVYQLQPSSISARRDFADRHETELRSCLDRSDITTSKNASGAELVDFAVGLIPESAAASQCLASIGVDTW